MPTSASSDLIPRLVREVVEYDLVDSEDDDEAEELMLLNGDDGNGVGEGLGGGLYFPVFQHGEVQVGEEEGDDYEEDEEEEEGSEGEEEDDDEFLL
jgi:hypothetical protein